jgi:hypothetical protein
MSVQIATVRGLLLENNPDHFLKQEAEFHFRLEIKLRLKAKIDRPPQLRQ